jgi:hypothetical protein
MSQTFMDRNLPLRVLVTNACIDVERVSAWKQRITRAYHSLAEGLPNDHLWKTAAFANAVRSEQLFTKIAQTLGCTAVEANFIQLLVYTQGLGRLVESQRALRGDPKMKWHHGRDTVTALQEILSEGALDTFLWQAALIAILHRPDAVAPTLKDINLPRSIAEATYALMGLLRDCVKLEAFMGDRLLLKLNDSSTKEKLRLENWSEERRAVNPQLGTEQGTIAPQEQLARFCEHLPLERPKYESYETLMLEILAYLFDIVNPEVTELIVKEGGPGYIYAYLERRLTSLRQMDAINRALVGWHRGYAQLIFGF